MKKVISESVEKIEEKLGLIFEGYLSNLESVFDVRIDEGCSIKKKKDEEEEVDDDEDSEEKGEKSDKEEKVEENVIKNKKGKKVTFSDSQDPDDEEVSEFSKDGKKTDGKSGYDDDVKPSSETPDKKIPKSKMIKGKKTNVAEAYSDFEEKKTKKQEPVTTEFTKDKKGTAPKHAGFDDESASGKTYDDDVDRKGEGELEDGPYEKDEAGFKEKEKVGPVSKSKKTRFPSKKPKIQGEPQAVKD